MNKQCNKIAYYFKSNKLVVLMIVISGLCFDGLMCFVPIFQGKLITSFRNQDELNIILKNALIFISLVVFVQVNRFLKRYFVRLFSNKITLTMRDKAMENILAQNLQNNSNISTGDMMNRVLSDINDTSEGIRKVTTEVFDSIVLMLGYFISLFFHDYKITLMILPFIVISISLSFLVKKKVATSQSIYKKEVSKSKDLTISLIENEMELRSLGLKENYDQLYFDELDILNKKAKKSLIWSTSLEPLYNLIAILGCFFVIYFGGKNVINQLWDIGVFSSYLTTYILVTTKTSKTAKAFNSYQKAKISWERCKPFLNNVSKQEKQVIKGNIDLKIDNVSFAFDDSCSIKIPSLCAKNGEIIAICGKVHSGKSTVVGLLSGLYSYSGSIKINNYELAEVNRENLYGIQFFDNEIFNYSFIENITFGRDEDLNEALNDTLLCEDINKDYINPNKVLTVNNRNLSGGQQKRLQLARAVYAHPKIIILDDPFNAIDESMSDLIFENLKNNYKDSIIFLVTNNKKFLNESDQIIFCNCEKLEINDYQKLLKNHSFRCFVGE